MANISNSLRSLADQFVQGVLSTLSAASLSELSALSGKSGRAPSHAAAPSRERKPVTGGRAASPNGGRRARRSTDDVVRLADDVVEFVRKSGGNVAVSDIAKGLDIGTSEINRPVAIALKEGRLHKSGEKRLTRYFVGTGAAGAKKARAKK